MPTLLRILAALMLVGCSAPTSQVDTGGAVRASRSGPMATAPPSHPTGPAQSADPDGEQFPSFVATVRPIGAALRDRMRFSHRPGCPLSWEELRHLRLGFVGFDGSAHVGEMVVHRDYAQDVTAAFEQLYEARWPIRQMRLVDEFEGDDDRSMAANNTSGYNCRHVADSSSWSTHAFGAALDINPVQNPYVTETSIAPPAGKRFAAIDRTAGRPSPVGVIRDGDVVVRAFARIGWQWGGDWSNSKDFQHFFVPGS